MPLYRRIVGIDLSLTNTGLAAISRPLVTDKFTTAGVYSTGWLTEDLKDPIRQFEIMKCVRGFVRTHKPEAVVIEDYAMGRAVGKAFTRAELGGMVKQWLLVTYGVPVFLVSPSALKSFMGVATRAKKGEKRDKHKVAMFEAASQRFRFINTDNDIVDAYCLTRYLDANGQGQRLTLVRLDPLPVYREITVQLPAPKKETSETKNRLLTTATGGPTFKPLPRRIRFS